MYAFETIFEPVLKVFTQISKQKTEDDTQALVAFHQELGGIFLTNVAVKHFFLLHGNGDYRILHKNNINIKPSESIRVTCFHNGKYYVCPDPKDVKQVEELQRQYDNGAYLSSKTYLITQKQYKDERNWNYNRDL